jgi:hypothetical protein
MLLEMISRSARLVAIVICAISSRTTFADELRTFHPDGTLKAEGTTTNGEKDGLFRYFNAKGAFSYQAYFVRGIEIWRSSETSDSVPAEVIEAFEATFRWAREIRVESGPVAPFVTLDRTPAWRRFGAALGIGSGGDLGIASIFRLDVFANYGFSFAGLYGQISQSLVASEGTSFLVGKSSLEIGGTSHQELAVPTAFRLGLVFPVVNDDDPGFLGSAAGTVMRAADAVASYPSSFAFRSSASVSITRARYRIQADAGLDVAIGGSEQLYFQPIARANAGVGWGTSKRLLALELSNTMDLRELSHRLHSIAVSGTYGFRRWSLLGAIVVTTDGHVSMQTTVTHDL